MVSHLHAGKVNAIIVTNGILLYKSLNQILKKKHQTLVLDLLGVFLKQLHYQLLKVKKHSRVSTHIGEFDRVLGGGIVKGSVTLVGGVSQVRESSAYITQIAKQYEIAVFLVGHVTKSGEVAGP